MGKTIKLLRISKGLTQEELATAIGVSASAIRRWENGKLKNVGVNQIIDIADYFRVSLDFILVEEILQGSPY